MVKPAGMRLFGGRGRWEWCGHGVTDMFDDDWARSGGRVLSHGGECRRVAGKEKGNFGFLVCRSFWESGGFVLEKGNVFVNARGWDINRTTDPGWAKCSRVLV